ncbi:MAG: DUF790 family protein [Lentisphaerae bacterium]|nr:DUF790 family protein [Lentisphaerota bacterium]
MSANAGDNTVLTKDLILCRSRANKLYPCFIAGDQPELLSLAEELLAVFRQGLGQPQSELENILNPLLSECTPLALGKGLRKLLLDRCEFSAPADLDYPAERQKILTASARLWQERTWASPEAFREALRQAVGAEHPLFGDNGLYCDHPDHDTLLSFKDLSARQLLERYNLALVQSLLLSAGSLELTLSSPEPAKLRRMCRYLRFFRLLCRIQRDGSDSTVLRLQIDGPTSIFQNARSYGLQLASFFPAVCALPRWQMQAEVLWKDKTALLQLDQSSGLVGYHHFGAYIPEEIQLFEKHFADTVQDWKIIDCPQFLPGEGNEIIFPDCSFANAAGKIVHLELFHRWHCSSLPRRLRWLEAHPGNTILLGVDRALLRDQELELQLQNSTWFQKYGFLFRDYPSVGKVLKGLQIIGNG